MFASCCGLLDGHNNPQRVQHFATPDLRRFFFTDHLAELPDLQHQRVFVPNGDVRRWCMDPLLATVQTMTVFVSLSSHGVYDDLRCIHQVGGQKTAYQKNRVCPSERMSASMK